MPWLARLPCTRHAIAHKQSATSSTELDGFAPCPRSTPVLAALADLTKVFQNVAGEGWRGSSLNAQIQMIHQWVDSCADAQSAVSAASPGVAQDGRFGSAVAAMLVAGTSALQSLVPAAGRAQQAGNRKQRETLLAFAAALACCQARALCATLPATLAVPGLLARAAPPRPLHAWLRASAEALATQESSVVAGAAAVLELLVLRATCAR